MQKSDTSCEKLLGEFGKNLSDQRRLSAYTSRNYLHSLHLFQTFLTGHKGGPITAHTLENLSAADFRAFLASRKREDVGAQTLKLDLSAIRTFYKFLRKQYDLSNAALSLVRAPKLPVRLPKPISVKDTALLRDALLPENKSSDNWQLWRDYALITLLYGAGLRISEALSLNWKDAPLKSALPLKGKGNKTRLVPILEEVKAAISQYQKALRQSKLAGSYPEKSFDDRLEPPLFFSTTGKPLSPRAAQAMLQKLRNKLGLPANTTPHALRHSFATHLLSQTGDLRAVQELLGHSSLAATQRYTQVDAQALLNTYKKAHPLG